MSQASSSPALSLCVFLTWHWPSNFQPELSLPTPATAPKLFFVNKHQAQCFCSTICGIWGAVVPWIRVCSNEHILQLSVGHRRCNYRAAWGISSASTVMVSQHSDIWADKFCGCKQQRLAENLDTGVQNGNSFLTWRQVKSVWSFQEVSQPTGKPAIAIWE